MMMMSFIVLTETKICLPLYTHWLLPALKKARVKMLLSCPLWCLDISFSPLVDLVLHLATTSPPPWMPTYTKKPTLMSHSYITTITWMSHSYMTTIIWMDLARLQAMILTSPPPLSRFKLQTGVSDSVIEYSIAPSWFWGCQSPNHYLLHHSQCPWIQMIKIWYHTPS